MYRTIGFAATLRVRLERVLAMGQRDRVVGPAAGATGELRRRGRARSVACSVTSRPSPSGRIGASAKAWKTCWAASGSQWMFHSVVGVVLPGTRKAPPMNTSRRSRRGSSGFALERDGQVRHRPERDQGQLAGSLGAPRR